MVAVAFFKTFSSKNLDNASSLRAATWALNFIPYFRSKLHTTTLRPVVKRTFRLPRRHCNISNGISEATKLPKLAKKNSIYGPSVRRGLDRKATIYKRAQIGKIHIEITLYVSSLVRQ